MDYDFKLLCCFCDNKFHNFDDLEKHLRSSAHRVNTSCHYFPCRTNKCINNPNSNYKNLHDFKLHVNKIHNISRAHVQKNISDDKTASKKDWIPSKINFENIIAESIANIRLRNALTGTAVGEFAVEMENILRKITKEFQLKTAEYFDHSGFKRPDSSLFIEQFTFDESFSKYSTMRSQINLLQKNHKYIQPTSKFLGVDNEEYMYVSITKTLELILSNEEVMEYIQNKSNKSEDNFLRTYEDGEAFKNHSFFQKYPEALRIQLYYDEFVGNNALSNKAKDHKIGAFYFSILNLPPHLNNFNGNVHVLALCLDKTVNKHNINDILEPFVREMQILESDEGYKLEINHKPYVLRATLATVTADTAAANPLLGFLGPAANLFCRVCLITRDDLLKRCYFHAEKRKKEILEEQLREIEVDGSVSTRTGVKQPCILNELLHFNSCFNEAFDVLHDLYEGWVPYVIKLIIAHFVIKKKVIDVDTINYRLKIFSIGGPERNHKPSSTFDLPGLKNVNSEHKLQQKAVQTWCLLRVLPFILFDKVDADDIYLEYLLNLNKIVEIIMAPKISPSTLHYLRALLKTHYNDFNILFPEARKINKLHHIMHLPDTIEKFGPVNVYSCFKYEDKHQLFQNYAKICKNFRNIPKSMINQSQINQCAVWGTNRKPIREKLTNYSIITMQVKDLQLSELFIKAGFEMNDKVGRTDKINVYSVKYKIDLFVAIELHEESGMPTFGEIKNIFIVRDEVFLHCKKWYSKYLEAALNAYNVEQSDDECLVNVSDLADIKPYALWNTFLDYKDYISLRYILY